MCENKERKEKNECFSKMRNGRFVHKMGKGGVIIVLTMVVEEVVVEEEE